MAAARRPPSSDPANIQLWRPTAMPRSARSAALLDMHKRPSSRKRMRSGPAGEGVGDRFGGLAAGRELGALLTQPGLQRDDERPALLIANALSLGRRLAFDVALDGEQSIHALDRLDGDRRLVDPRQVEELAPRMRPAHRLADRSRLPHGLV